MSDLRTYLATNNIRQADFAAAVNSTQSTISKLMAGRVSPSGRLAVAIERETGGAVTAASWFDEHRFPSQKAS